MLEIARMLTISTAHISKETADLLAGNYPMKLVPVWEMSVGIYGKEEYGWYIYFSPAEHIHPSMPEDLAACLRLARQQQCSVLCLDSDGDVVEGLPVYDW